MLNILLLVVDIYTKKKDKINCYPDNLCAKSPFVKCKKTKKEPKLPYCSSSEESDCKPSCSSSYSCSSSKISNKKKPKKEKCTKDPIHVVKQLLACQSLDAHKILSNKKESIDNQLWSSYQELRRVLEKAIETNRDALLSKIQPFLNQDASKICSIVNEANIALALATDTATLKAQGAASSQINRLARGPPIEIAAEIKTGCHFRDAIRNDFNDIIREVSIAYPVIVERELLALRKVLKDDSQIIDEIKLAYNDLLNEVLVVVGLYSKQADQLIGVSLREIGLELELLHTGVGHAIVDVVRQLGPGKVCFESKVQCFDNQAQTNPQINMQRRGQFGGQNGSYQNGHFSQYDQE